MVNEVAWIWFESIIHVHRENIWKEATWKKVLRLKQDIVGNAGKLIDKTGN
jgi:hypothetical protein